MSARITDEMARRLFKTHSLLLNEAMREEDRLSLADVDWDEWYRQEAASPLNGQAFVAHWTAMAAAALSQPEAEGLSPWMGWDQARPPWGECKHKDAVLEALFRAPWSVEDAATLVSFIERTWPRATTLTVEEDNG